MQVQGVSSTEDTLFSLEAENSCKFYGGDREMKKFLVFVLSVLLTFCCAIGFAACDETPPDDETGGTVQPDDPGKPHEHDFGE